MREKLAEIRRYITGVDAPHAVLQPPGRWIRHLHTSSARPSSRST
ncbi:hypothetical protein [Streptomyces sp. LX-29]|nr:hypothetical protein [Streptomyces sp. LX-29]